MYTWQCTAQSQLTLSAGHGLQWLWPFLLGYAPHKTAILDEVCITHPTDSFQGALKASLNTQLQQQTLALQPKSTLISLLALVKQSWKGIKAKPSDMPQFTAEALSQAPGMAFLPMRAPGGEEAKQEINMQLKRFQYKAELYGVKDRSADLIEAVFQPWYQELLDMGSIQVGCRPAACCVSTRWACVILSGRA